MKKPSRRLILAALAAIVGVASGLALAHRRRATDAALAREFDLAVKRREAIFEAHGRRPVLRGEALPGDGGRTLDTALRALEKHAAGYEEHPVWWLPRVLEGGGEPEDVDRAIRAFEEMRVRLSHVRDALQHESCRLPSDPARSFWAEVPTSRLWAIKLAGKLLELEADLLAEQGNLRAALAAISDAIRYGHDLRRGAPSLYLSLIAITVESSAIMYACALLASYSATREDLARFLEELSILDRTWPSLPAHLEGVECEGVIELVLRFRGDYPEFEPMPPGASFWWKVKTKLRGQWPDFGPMTAWERESTRLLGVDFEEYHRVWRSIREASTLPAAEMREMSDRLEATAEGLGELAPPPARRLVEMDLKSRTLLACLRAAVIVHLHRAEHGGTWPVDPVSVGALPPDPWDGRPLRYRPAEAGRPPFVYSVGANLIDDGGRADGPLEFGAEDGNEDFVFPLGPWPEGEAAGREADEAGRAVEEAGREAGETGSEPSGR